jgi:L-iditol 2-dehydrogenase
MITNRCVVRSKKPTLRPVLGPEHLARGTFPIPAHITDDEAICTEPLACVLKAVRRGGFFEQGRVLVLGLGFIGLMAAHVYRLQGNTVFSVDRSVERLKNATTFGLHRLAFLPEQLPYDQFDLVFLTVVNEQTLAYALEKVRDGGKIILFSDETVTVNASTLYYREITVIPSYSPGTIDLREAARLIFSNQIWVAPLITHQYTLDQADTAFQVARGQDAIKVVVSPLIPLAS